MVVTKHSNIREEMKIVFQIEKMTHRDFAKSACISEQQLSRMMNSNLPSKTMLEVLNDRGYDVELKIVPKPDKLRNFVIEKAKFVNEHIVPPAREPFMCGFLKQFDKDGVYTAKQALEEAEKDNAEKLAEKMISKIRQGHSTQTKEQTSP